MGVGKGGQGGPWPPPGFSHTLSKSSQISKILPFLVVNTGSILIGPPPENFSADALGGELICQKLKSQINENFKKCPKISNQI